MLQVEYRKTVDLELIHNNPRTIKEEDFKRLCESVEKNKLFFEARPIILSDRTGMLVVIAGNQRLRAAIEIGLKEVPTVLIPGLTEEQETEIVFRDNISNGDFDWDIIANEFSDFPLEDWGVDVPVIEEFQEEPEDESGKPSFVKLVIEFGSIPEYDDAKEEIRTLLAKNYLSASIKE